MPKKQKSGLYRSKVKIGVDANGKDVFKYISGHTKKGLEEHRQEVIAHFIEGTALDDDRLFGTYAAEWYRVRKEPFIRKGTKDTYRSMLNNHILPAFGNRKLRSIRAIELQDFLQQFEGSSRSHITVARLILNGIFASACRDHILKDNPAQYLENPTPKQAAEKPSLTVEARAAIESVCVGDPNGAFLAVLYYLGLRIGEAAGLKWCDFDWQTRFVHIQRKIDYHDNGAAGDPKTEKSNRLVPIPDALFAILYPIRQMPDMYLFHTNGNQPISEDSARTLWLKLMHSAGLTHEEKRVRKNRGKDVEKNILCPDFTPHTLRHNYITMCYESGLDTYAVMRLAGHTNISTTMNIYTHLTQQQLDKTRDEVNAVFKSKSCTKVAQPTET